MHTQRKSTGFTLIDTIVWIAIFTIVMLAVVQAVLFFYRTNAYVLEEATAISAAERGLHGMVHTIREATYSSVGAYPVVALSTSSLTIYADIDADPRIERVRYYLSGEQLYRAIVEPTGDPASYAGAESESLITESIKNIAEGIDLFTYYDEAGESIVDHADIGSLRFVTIELVADIDPNRPPPIITLRSSAALRNLLD
jgi:type II secretory pathway pseudopilin PulG